jgi:Tfp pilus assembly protein PilN
MLGSSTQTATVARVNLLPPEIAEKASLRKAQIAMVGTGLAAVAVVGALYVQQTGNVASARKAKVAAVADQAKLTKDLAGLQHVRDTYAKVDAAKATLASAMQYEVQFSSYLHDLTLTIPDNVWLASITATVTPPTAAAGSAVLDPGVGSITFVGVSVTHEDLGAWLDSLTKEKGYANVYFTQANEALIGPRKVVNFTSSINLTTAALRNQYSKGAGK